MHQTNMKISTYSIHTLICFITLGLISAGSSFLLADGGNPNNPSGTNVFNTPTGPGVYTTNVAPGVSPNNPPGVTNAPSTPGVVGPNATPGATNH